MRVEFIERIKLEFTDSRDKGLDASIDFCSVLGTEASTDLHFGFGGSCIPFCLVVGERHFGMESKCHHSALMFAQAVKEVSPFALLWLAARFSYWRRFFSVGLLEQILIPGINLDSMTGEYGYRGGGARPDCALLVVQGRNDGAESALPTTISEGFLEVRGTAVWLFKQPEKQAWQFDLVNGKVIHSFNGDYTDSELIDLQEANIPAGHYFGQLRDKTGVKNIRLTKSN